MRAVPLGAREFRTATPPAGRGASSTQSPFGLLAALFRQVRRPRSTPGTSVSSSVGPLQRLSISTPSSAFCSRPRHLWSRDAHDRASVLADEIADERTPVRTGYFADALTDAAHWNRQSLDRRTIVTRGTRWVITA